MRCCAALIGRYRREQRNLRRIRANSKSAPKPQQDALVGMDLGRHPSSSSLLTPYIFPNPPFSISISAFAWRKYRFSRSFILALGAQIARRSRLSGSFILDSGAQTARRFRLFDSCIFFWLRGRKPRGGFVCLTRLFCLRGKTMRRFRLLDSHILDLGAKPCSGFICLARLFWRWAVGGNHGVITTRWFR